MKTIINFLNYEIRLIDRMLIDKEKLKKEQTELASKIIITSESFKKANLIGGVDVAYCNHTAICSIVICEKDMNIVPIFVV